jgi:hypothetical protein
MARRSSVLLAVLLVCLVMVVDAGPAAAGWSVTGTGPARSTARSMPTIAAPTVAKSTASSGIVYTVQWSAAGVGTGQPVVGYLVRRTIFPGTAQARYENIASGTCAGTTYGSWSQVYLPASPTTGAQSCTDPEGYAKGQVTYNVTPVYQQWIGTTSPESAIISP